jgi:hypothetical protein
MRIYWQEIVGLFVLAIPIACIARTVVFEEVFREPREYCEQQSKFCRALFARKFFYLFTCEYCFSHYVTAAFLLITRYHLLFDDWRGYLISFFSLVFVANLYLNLYSRMRVEITVSKKEAEAKGKEVEKLETEICEKLGTTPAERNTSNSPQPREPGRPDNAPEPIRA